MLSINKVKYYRSVIALMTNAMFVIYCVCDDIIAHCFSGNTYPDRKPLIINQVCSPIELHTTYHMGIIVHLLKGLSTFM